MDMQIPMQKHDASVVRTLQDQFGRWPVAGLQGTPLDGAIARLVKYTVGPNGGSGPPVPECVYERDTLRPKLYKP